MNGAGAPDFFCREARRLGYVARSAFKLLQFQNQYKLIKPGSSVLDLGCAPGAWLQVACESLGPFEKGGTVVGIDAKKIRPPSQHCDARVKTFRADVMTLPIGKFRALSPKQKGFSVILSDMCPLVSGIKDKDAFLSMELGMRAIDLALGAAASAHANRDFQMEGRSNSISGPDDIGLLLPGGNLVIKLLDSEDAQVIIKICKPLFRQSAWSRPKATRPSSREIYLISQCLKSTRK